MLYIAPISDQHIQMNEEVKRFYVEYGIPLTSQNAQGIHYLKKVYLGPKAENKLEILLKKLWTDMSYASENK